MPFYLLDAGGAFFLVYFFIAGLIFLVLAVLAEAGIMTLFKYAPFRKSFRLSLIVNAVSFVIGMILVFVGDSFFGLEDWAGFAGLFGVTVVSETIVLYLLNKTVPVGKTILVSVVMNIVSYAILYLLYYSQF